MRSIFVFIILLSSAVRAQEKKVAVTENGKPYLVKTIEAGETLSSVSRHYNITSKDLAGFNKLDVAAGLKKGQAIKVPLTNTNLLLEECANCSKVYYKVPPKEGLFRIAANFNNIGLPGLKTLNNLTEDNVAIGQLLLVGFLKEGESQAIPVMVDRAEKIEVVSPQKDVVIKVEDVNHIKKKVLNGGMTEGNLPTPELLRSAFASQYLDKMGSNINGTSGIFKSTSGWNDNKYYVLMSNVAPGTIVKVVATTTNKALYAKVLGELPPMKQNDSIVVRISNAAAAVLGGGEEDMGVVVSY